VRGPTLRRTLYASSFSLCVGVMIITIFEGLRPDYPVRLIQGLMAAVAALAIVGAAVAWITTRLGDYRHPADEREFELLVRSSERMARENLAAEPDEGEFMELDPYNAADFEELVRDALDDLPDVLRSALDRNVAVIISDQGRRHRAYGLYQGGTVAREIASSDRIVIFRDTLLRDFGHDPDELRAQVLRTVRHELAHHLGADELGVRELGL
jgi:predicted Zn-dependent protease with MMP-like domain